MRRSKARFIWLAGLIVVVAALSSWAQLSGQFDLDLLARRIPTTVTEESQMGTPSEYTVLEFAIGSELDLTLNTEFIKPQLKANINTAGIEHFVFLSPITFSDVSIQGATLDRLSIVPEIWIGVPFEYVRDINDLPNSVVIPPGNLLFASARATVACTIGGFRVEQLFMLDDVSFPRPSGSYDPLYYEHSDQEYDVGTLMTVSWRASIGVSMRAEFGLNASQASKSIKGHTARGSVTPDSSFARVTVGGIKLGSTSLFGVGIQNLVLGTSFSVATGTDHTLSTRVSLSGEAWSGASISGSITLTPIPASLSGLSLSISAEPFRLGIALDDFDITGLSANLGSSLSLGAVSGSWSFSATGIERGLTGLAGRLSLAQGTFSTSTSVSFSQSGDKLAFASWSSSLSFRFSPAVVSVQATFGRNGLTRAEMSVRVVF